VWSFRTKDFCTKKTTTRAAGNNAIKMPLLAKLVRKYHSSPATSVESERLFSIAGLIVSDLRKRLLPENVEMLLFLHHNLLILDMKY